MHGVRGTSGDLGVLRGLLASRGRAIGDDPGEKSGADRAAHATDRFVCDKLHCELSEGACGARHARAVREHRRTLTATSRAEAMNLAVGSPCRTCPLGAFHAEAHRER